MTTFDPVAFLDSVGVEHDVGRRNVTCRCPDCGDSDLDGDNFGFRLDGQKWGCWRDRSHGGPLGLVIRKLTGWSLDQVDAYLESSTTTTPLDELRRRQAAIGVKEQVKPVRLAFPPEFKLPRHPGFTSRFYVYLKSRGFDDVDGLVQEYQIRCAAVGQFKDRIILPIFWRGALVGWTARALGPARLRYVAHPEGGQIKEYLFNGQAAVHGGRVLVVVEGPVDALKIDWYGKALGVRSVGLMGTVATAAQAEALAGLSAGFDRTVILLDAAAGAQARSLAKLLPGVRNLAIEQLVGWKDPGEMTPPAVRNLCRRLRRAA